MRSPARRWSAALLLVAAGLALWRAWASTRTQIDGAYFSRDVSEPRRVGEGFASFEPATAIWLAVAVLALAAAVLVVRRGRRPG